MKLIYARPKIGKINFNNFLKISFTRVQILFQGVSVQFQTVSNRAQTLSGLESSADVFVFSAEQLIK